MGNQGVVKVYNQIQKRFEWPGLKKACEKWISACLSCQQAKVPRKLNFPLQSLESSGFNEVVRIDRQKKCKIATGYNQVLVVIDHFTVRRSSSRYDSISGENVLPPDKCMNSETRLPNHIPKRQWQSIRG